MSLSRTQYDISIDQSGAGTTELFAATPQYEIRVVSYLVVLSAAGTYAFSDGTDWKTGDIPLDAKSGVTEQSVDADNPLFVCGVNRPLSITTTGGSAHGRVRIELR